MANLVLINYSKDFIVVFYEYNLVILLTFIIFALDFN